jgi:hypothetical protein
MGKYYSTQWVGILKLELILLNDLRPDKWAKIFPNGPSLANNVILLDTAT